jgi:hypothetical protein
MNRLSRALVLASVALAATAGCTANDRSPQAQPTSSATHKLTIPPPTTAPATTPAAAPELSGKGVGPYTVGMALSALKSSNAVVEVNGSNGCPDWKTAKGTGKYKAVALVFFKDKLDWVEVSTPDFSTVEGAKVGMPLTAVAGAFGSQAKQLSDGLGGKAVGVSQSGGSGLVFRANADGNVNLIQAGAYETLEFKFTDGEGC